MATSENSSAISFPQHKYQRIIELKHALRDAVLVETLNLEAVQRDHAEYRRLLAEYESNCARNEDQRKAEDSRKQEVRTARRAEAATMSKAALAAACGLSASSWTKGELIDHYAGLTIS